MVTLTGPYHSNCDFLVSWWQDCQFLNLSNSHHYTNIGTSHCRIHSYWDLPCKFHQALCPAVDQRLETVPPEQITTKKENWHNLTWITLSCLMFLSCAGCIAIVLPTHYYKPRIVGLIISRAAVCGCKQPRVRSVGSGRINQHYVRKNTYNCQDLSLISIHNLTASNVTIQPSFGLNNQRNLHLCNS